MKRKAVVSALFIGLLSLVGRAQAAPTRADVPPIALNGENGTLSVYVYLGTSTENMAVPMMGTVPVKVCDGADCQTYTGNYMSDNEGYSMHRYIYTDVSIGERFGKKPVTAQVPSDLVDGSKGWSAASNAVTGWTDSIAWFKTRSSRPVLEVQYKAIDGSSITRADLCANYRDGANLVKNVSGFVTFDLSGYTSIKYVLLENGTQIKTEDLSSLMASMSSIPACGGGVMGTNLLKTIDGLTAGRSYKLTYTVSGAGKTDVTATLDFVAPGACPTGEIVLPPSPRTYYYGVLGADGYLKSYLATGTYQWRVESILGDRLAPIYFSASKVGPYKGKLLNVRDSTEKWRYVKEVDDWALVVENAVPVTAANVLSYTVFADCSSTSVKPTLTLDETKVKAADQACVIDGNEVVPTKAGQCIVKARVPAAGVSSSGVGKRATDNEATMNYVFASVGTFTRTASTTSSTTSTTVLSSTTAAASPSCSVVLTSAKKSATNASLLKCAGLSKRTGQTVSLRVAAGSSKVCAATSAGIVRRAKGTCRVTVRLLTKSKVSASRSITIPSK